MKIFTVSKRILSFVRNSLWFFVFFFLYSPIAFNFRPANQMQKQVPVDSKRPIVEIKCDTPITTQSPNQSPTPQAKYVPQFVTPTTSGDTLMVYAECSSSERWVHQIKFPPELIQEGEEKPLTVSIV